MNGPVLKTHTLGCKVNQYETEYVREGLHQIGYVDGDADQPADLCIVNTCTVTNEGDSKSRQIIRRMARQNPDARIIVMGCYATRDPEAVAALPQVAEVVVDKRELPDLLGRFGVVDIPDGISRFGNRHRAYVKVQDGCLLRCSYCIIPKVRPQMHSRPMQAHLARSLAFGCQWIPRDRSHRSPSWSLRGRLECPQTQEGLDSTFRPRAKYCAIAW